MSAKEEETCTPGTPGTQGTETGQGEDRPTTGGPAEDTLDTSSQPFSGQPGATSLARGQQTIPDKPSAQKNKPFILPSISVERSATGSTLADSPRGHGKRTLLGDVCPPDTPGTPSLLPFVDLHLEAKGRPVSPASPRRKSLRKSQDHAIPSTSKSSPGDPGTSTSNTSQGGAGASKFHSTAESYQRERKKQPFAQQSQQTAKLQELQRQRMSGAWPGTARTPPVHPDVPSGDLTPMDLVRMRRRFKPPVKPSMQNIHPELTFDTWEIESCPEEGEAGEASLSPGGGITSRDAGEESTYGSAEKSQQASDHPEQRAGVGQEQEGEEGVSCTEKLDRHSDEVL